MLFVALDFAHRVFECNGTSVKSLVCGDCYTLSRFVPKNK